MNVVFLTGYLGRDPEIRYTQAGKEVANFSLATKETWKGSDGQQDRTEWHNVVAFGRAATKVANALRKGSLAHVEGRLQTREWADKKGDKRKTTEVVADYVWADAPVESTEPKSDRQPDGGEDVPF